MSRINDLKEAIGVGARANMFEIELNSFLIPIPTGDANLLAKAVTFPGKTIAVSEAFYRGKKYMLPGKQDYGNSVSITFYDTEDHSLRNAFFYWMTISEIDEIRDISMLIKQVDHKGDSKSIAGGGTYQLISVWPQSIEDVSMDRSSSNTLMEFSVTLSFDSVLNIPSI